MPCAERIPVEQLHGWLFETRTGRQMLGQEDGSTGVDDEFVAAGQTGLGATIMGRNMFGPILLGRGERLLDDLTGYQCTAFVSSPSAMHARLERTAS